jgi:hypothetical protein
MKLINLTPHEINVGEILIPPSGDVARCNSHTIDAGTVYGIPVIETRITGISGVPEPQSGVGYIVPSMVRVQFPKRRDLYSPAKFIRDKNGSITGCMSLEINPL